MSSYSETKTFKVLLWKQKEVQLPWEHYTEIFLKTKQSSSWKVQHFFLRKATHLFIPWNALKKQKEDTHLNVELFIWKLKQNPQATHLS